MIRKIREHMCILCVTKVIFLSEEGLGYDMSFHSLGPPSYFAI